MDRKFHSTTLIRPPRIAGVGDVYEVLVSGDETADRYAVLRATVPPGGGPPMHRHSREDEGFYIVSGEITVKVDGKTVKAGPGEFVNLPQGSAHCFTNETTQPAVMLITVSPSGFEKFLMEYGTPLGDSHTAPILVTPEEIERIIAIAPKYGIEMIH